MVNQLTFQEIKEKAHEKLWEKFETITDGEFGFLHKFLKEELPKTMNDFLGELNYCGFQKLKQY